MKYNFKEIIVLDLEWNKQEGVEVYKVLANALYTLSTNDLDLVTKAIEINKWNEVELDKVEIETIKWIVKNEKAGFYAFVQKAIIDYIDNQK